MRWSDLNDPAFRCGRRSLDRRRLDRGRLGRHCKSDDVVLLQVYVTNMAVTPSGELPRQLGARLPSVIDEHTVERQNILPGK